MRNREYSWLRPAKLVSYRSEWLLPFSFQTIDRNDVNDSIRRVNNQDQ